MRVNDKLGRVDRSLVVAGSSLIDWERADPLFKQSDSHLSFIIRAPHFHRPLGTGPQACSRKINDRSMINGSISNPDC